MCWLSSDVIAGLAGGVIAIGGQLIVHWIHRGPQRRLDESRKTTLKVLLDPKNHPLDVKDGWRNMKTLQRVVGADHETTARLLIEIGARGSTSTNDVWALIKHKPLPTKKDEE